MLSGFIKSFTALFVVQLISFDASAHQNANNEFPRIWVNQQDKRKILSNIKKYEWAQSLKAQLEKRVNPYSNRHQSDPEFLLSRIPRTWSGNHYTDAVIANNPTYNAADVPDGAPFTVSGQAPIPTLHRAFDYGIKSKEGGRFVHPQIEELPAYNKTPFFGMTLKLQHGEKTEYVPYLARHLRTIYTDFLILGVDSAVLYYLTGKPEYAQLSADILWAFIEPLHYMNTVETPRLHASGMLITNYLRDARITMPMFPLIYDFVHDFINSPNNTVFDAVTGKRRPFDDELAQGVFFKLAKTVLQKGILKSNWAILEGDAILNNVLVIKDKTLRSQLFEQFYWKGTPGHDAFAWSINNLTSEKIWPESNLYAFDVSKRLLQLMETIDRNKDLLNVDVFANNGDVFEGPYVFHNMEYPNGKMMAFGDSYRKKPEYGKLYAAVASAARQAQLPEQEARAKEALRYHYHTTGDFEPTISTSTLSYFSPLQLLRGTHFELEKGQAYAVDKLSSLHVSHAGVVMQRNYHSSDIVDNGLMYYTGGSSYVHAHASGIDMELYGAGMVIAPDFGSGGYGKQVHNTYAIQYASHNTVIVNGKARRGNNNWEEVMNSTQLDAIEPLPRQAPISEQFSFSCQSLNDTYNQTDNQRCIVMARIGDKSGYYLDLFRAKSKQTTEFTDYLYHNLGESTDIHGLDDSSVSLTNDHERYSSKTADKYQSPGWHWFKQVRATDKSSSGYKIRFNLEKVNSYMHAIIPASVKEREVSLAKGPSAPGVSHGYDKTDNQIMTIRHFGEAWNNAYIVVYEPSKLAEGNVKHSELLTQNGKVIGAIVESFNEGTKIRDIIVLQDNSDASTNLPELGLKFKGRAAIVRTLHKPNQNQEHTLYIGDGELLEFQGHVLEAKENRKAVMAI
jgi:hypothetical protein